MKKLLLTTMTTILPLVAIVSCSSPSQKEDKQAFKKIDVDYIYSKNGILLNSINFNKKDIKEQIISSLSFDKTKFSKTSILGYQFNKKIAEDVLKTKRIIVKDKEIKLDSIKKYERTYNSIILKDVSFKIEDERTKQEIKRVVDTISLTGFNENKKLKIIEEVTNQEITNIHNFSIANMGTKFPSSFSTTIPALPTTTLNKNGIDYSMSLDNSQAFKDDDNGKIIYKVKIISNSESVIKDIEKTGFMSNIKYLNDLKTNVESKINVKPLTTFLSYLSGNNKILTAKDKIKSNLEDVVKKIDKLGVKRDDLKISISNEYDNMKFGALKQNAAKIKFSIELGNSKIKVNEDVSVEHSLSKWPYQLAEWLKRGKNINEVKKFILRNKKLDANGVLTAKPLYSNDFSSYMSVETIANTLEEQVKIFFKKYTKKQEEKIPNIFSKNERWKKWIDGTSINAYIDKAYRSYDQSTGIVKMKIRIVKNELTYKIPVEFNIQSINTFNSLSPISLIKSDIATYNKNALNLAVLNKMKTQDTKRFSDVSSINLIGDFKRDGVEHEMIANVTLSDGTRREAILKIKYTMDNAEKVSFIKSITDVVLGKDVYLNQDKMFINALKDQYPEIESLIKTTYLGKENKKKWNTKKALNIIFSHPDETSSDITQIINFNYKSSSGYEESKRIHKLIEFISKKSSGTNMEFKVPSTMKWWIKNKIDIEFQNMLKNITFNGTSNKIWDSKNYDYPGEYTFKEDKKLLESKDWISNSISLKQFDLTVYTHGSNTKITDIKNISSGNKYDARIKIVRNYSSNAEFGEWYTEYANRFTINWQ